MEFNYDGWSYEADREEIEKAKEYIILDTIKWEISRRTGNKKFSESDIRNFTLIAGLIMDGQFENINDDDFMYDELKEYFYNKKKWIV